MRIVVTDVASDELDSIFEYVAADNLDRAADIVSRIDDAIQDLRVSALSYALYPNRAAAGVRRRIVRPYLIFYRVTGDLVEVLHIVHGARDLNRILKD